MKIKIDFNQKSIINFLIADISITAVKFYIVQSIPSLYQYNYIANVFISMILLLFMIPAFIAVLKKKPYFVIGCLIGFVLLISSQLIFFQNNESMIFSYLPKIIGMSLGCLIIANGLTDFDAFNIKLIWASRVIIFFAAIQFISFEFLGVLGSERLDYNMSFGFYLVVPTITLFTQFFIKKKYKYMDAILSGIGGFMALIMGSRGSILAIILGFFLCYIIEIDIGKIKDFLKIVFSLIVVFVFSFEYKKIALFLYGILEQKNIKSRLLAMLLYGNITSTTGRQALQASVKSLINQHPLIGNGILCDLRSHNIFIEGMLFFGIPVGIFLILFICFQWVKPIFEKNKEKKFIMLVFLSYVIVDSSLNLTVLGKDMFWIYLGFALTTKIKFKINRIN